MSNNSLESSRITFPDPEYATCAEAYVKLLIYPGKNDLGEVIKILQIESAITQWEGEEFMNSRGRKRVAKNSLWFLSSEKKIHSKDLRDHLNWLINKISPNALKLKELQKWDGLKMTVSCVWWSAYGHSGPVLWPEQMKALADLNLECSFDIYFLNES